MTIQYLDSRRLTGLSSDTKPTTLSDNSIFIETDTGGRYIFDGDRWKPTSKFDSLYDSFTSNKQHFVEWFSGKELGHYWTQTNVTGTGTFAINNSVDGGFSISSGANVNDESYINFNNKRQFSPTGSVIIFVSKKFFTGGSDGIEMGGLRSNITNSNVNNALLENSSGGSEIPNLRTSDSSASSTTSASSASGDTSFHAWSITCGSSNIILSEDGITEVTKTTNRPTISMQPFYGVLNSSVSGADVVNIRYMECYNT